MDFEYTNIRGNYLPLIPVELIGKKWLEFIVFADTGANRSIFHSDVGYILGIAVETGKKTEAMTAEGSFITVYLHTIHVRFCGKEFEASIGFSKRLGAEFNVLGRKDFFERFVFCFNDYNKILSVNEIK